MADKNPSTTAVLESGGKLFLAARVPRHLEITRPGFSSMGREFPPPHYAGEGHPEQGREAAHRVHRG
eukprot:6844910-Pyramimonas_sp.AAC.1